MGVSLKAFIIDDDDTVHRITYAMYKRLVAQEPEARLCQYADRRVRYALIAVEMKDRKPKDILHTEWVLFRILLIEKNKLPRGNSQLDYANN